eukprot:125415-Ditylum_brightwellii.AAC.1
MSVRRTSTEVHALAFMMLSRPLRALLSNLKHKGGHAEGDHPKKTVWHRREQIRSGTSGFWRGRVLARIKHRQGKHNM